MRKTKTEPKRNTREVAYIPERPVKLLKPQSVNQGMLISATKKPEVDIVFAAGPAGTGKTYGAGGSALDMLQAGIVKQIILTRPYVPAGESYGHLPGTIEEKFAPYLQPYLQVFTDRIGKQLLNQMLEDGRITAVPIGFLQGLTFQDCVVLVDEAENLTLDQARLIMTRLGKNKETGGSSKVFFMGDEKQAYIKNSGFMTCIKIFESVSIARTITFSIADVVRSNVCRVVLEAFENYEDAA